VPNASIMVIGNAERFGLAQLHQLRGRVGRGAYQSYCYLLSDSRGEATAQRLGIMEATNDGFVIAEQDLKLRGPGEFIGTRQSGMPDMLLADLVEDTVLLERARETAIRMVAADPTLDQRPLLKADMVRYFKANLDFLSA
jgi:ATP-dependent DNA helicase RecG